MNKWQGQGRHTFNAGKLPPAAETGVNNYWVKKMKNKIEAVYSPTESVKKIHNRFSFCMGVVNIYNKEQIRKNFLMRMREHSLQLLYHHQSQNKWDPVTALRGRKTILHLESMQQ